MTHLAWSQRDQFFTQNNPLNLGNLSINSIVSWKKYMVKNNSVTYNPKKNVSKATVCFCVLYISFPFSFLRKTHNTIVAKSKEMYEFGMVASTEKGFIFII